MITSAMGVQSFRWPAGVYLATNDYNHIVMAMETSITKEGVSYLEVTGTPTENEELKQNYAHLCKLRDEL
jgi:malate dehydrogenase